MVHHGQDGSVAKTALIVASAAALVVVLVAIAWIALQPFLLAFGGVLFGTALRGLAEVVARKTGWRTSWSLVACVAALAIAALAAGLWIVPNVADQFGSLSQKLTQGYERLRQSASQSTIGSQLLGGAAAGGEQIASIMRRATGALASVVGALGAALFVFFVALYVAGSPGTYRRGVVRLVPPPHRDRAREILDALASTLRRWLLGRMVSMTAVGVATWIGLSLLGIPLPFTLALIAGALGFVPNIGPIVSAIPAVLLAITVSPMHAVYVAALYLAINLADGYGLTPMVDRRAVSVPPALVLTSQVVLGAVAGVLGVMFATPLIACTLVLVRELYVRDRLEGGRAGA